MTEEEMHNELLKLANQTNGKIISALIDYALMIKAERVQPTQRVLQE